MISARWRLRRPGLVAEVLAAQIAIALAVGLTAIVAFALITSAVVKTNLLRLASSWAEQLDELGAPLYVGDQTSAIVDLHRFIASYPEVVQVELYTPGGERITAVDNGTGDLEPLPPPDEQMLSLLESLAATTPPALHTEELGGRRFLLRGPVVVESLAEANLLEFDPETAESHRKIIGYVGLELDYSASLSGLWPQIITGAIAIMLVIVIGWTASRILLKRALEPLEALQTPLRQLAKGETDIVLPEPRHHELARIVLALRETIDALTAREKHLLHLASRDALTGLYNRYRLMQKLAEEIEHCRRVGRTSALLFIDLDQFKYVNDTGGHAAGDALLVTAAQQILGSVRKRDAVARFGGDEFIVLLKNIKRGQARKVAEQVLESMRHVSHTDGKHVFQLQCSIGVAIIGSARSGPEEVLLHADLACQSAKRRGRNRVEVYRISSKQDKQIARDVSWMRQIRESLVDDSFVLHFQPLMHVASGKITHYEALLRVQTEDGLVGPATFLPAAARFGLMSSIDFWVIENAIRTLADLEPEQLKAIRLSVNISGFALEQTDLVPRIRSLLSTWGVPGERLVFELTEHLAVRFASDTDKRLEQIRELGIGLAIDDFGTGYSSFSYLKRLPVDFLKIDGSFVRNVARSKVDQCMVRMTAELAREVGLRTVAEYVQSKAAMSLLEEYGVDYAQGSYIGRASPSLGKAVTEPDTAKA